MRKSRLRPWEIISSRRVFDAEPWLSVDVQRVRLPDGRVVDDYHQIRLPDFAIVFAQTSDGRVVIERQYRHGLGEVSLTLPAGALEGEEAPLAAAQRELLEETGFRAYGWQSLGTFAGHANYGCGMAHLFKAQDAHQVTEPDSEDLEDVQILLMKPDKLIAAIRQGDMRLLGSVGAVALAMMLG